MSEIPILTAQNVAINFVAAPLNKRIIAYLIDYGIKLSYLILIVFYVMTGTISEFMMDPWSENAIFIILLLPYIFYTFSLEWLLEGQTIGKKLMHIKVVKIDGFQASVFDYFVRWGFRVVDIIGSFGLISIFMISSGKYRQRIGDIAAGTSVIQLTSNVDISHTILVALKEEYKPVFANVIRLSDNDMRIIKEQYLLGIQSNDIEKLEKLRKKIFEVSGIESTMGHHIFFNTILKDYNYFTKQ